MMLMFLLLAVATAMVVVYLNCDRVRLVYFNEMAHRKELLICIKYKLNYMFVVHSALQMENPKCIAYA